jgi:hypothetical protein
MSRPGKVLPGNQEKEEKSLNKNKNRYSKRKNLQPIP